MKRRALAAAVAAVVVFLAAHRGLVHEAAALAGYALAAAAGLGAVCLAAAGLSRLRGRIRPRPAVTRARLATAQPAGPRPVAAGRPGDPCSIGCGQPATRMFERWPVCDSCGGRLDEAAGQYALGTAAGSTPAVAVTVPEIRQWAFGPDGEPLPDGESMLGYLDMTDYEEDLNS